MDKKSKKLVSKFFRVASEGMALNGLEITADMINKMAATYNTAKYTANINVEHIRGFSLTSDFPTLGKVVEARAQNFTTENGETKLGLDVKVEAYVPLIKAYEANQKLGWSIEVDDLPDTKEPYLTGLAATDSPASLYTQTMEFSIAKNEGQKGKYSDFIEATIELEEVTPPEPKTSFFSQFFSKDKEAPKAITLEPQIGEIGLPDELKTELQKFSTEFSGLQSKVESLETENNTLKAELAGLTQKFSVLELTPDGSTGHPTTNNADPIILADC